MRPPVIQEDRIEIRPWNDDEVALHKAHIRIEIRGEKSAWFIALNPADQHESFPRFLAVNLVYVQLIGRIGKIHEVLPSRLGFNGNDQDEQWDEKPRGRPSDLSGK
jgi:hypothetical protein